MSSLSQMAGCPLASADPPRSHGSGALGVLKNAMFIGHSVVMLGIVLTTYRMVQGEEQSLLMVAGQLAFGLIYFYAILSLRDLSSIVYPSGVFLVFVYLAYLLKSFVYLVDEDLFFRNWITLNSPMAYATFADWANAVLLSAAGTGLFAFGNMAAGAFGARRRAFPQLDARRSRSNPMVAMLAVGLGFVLLRIFVTWGLGLGASSGASNRVFLFPGLAGFLQLLSLWGGRMVFAATFAYAATSRSIWGIAGALGETIAFGCLGMAATGSKSEVMLPLIIIGVVAVYLRKSIPQTLLVASLGTSAMIVMIAVTIYPAMHQYRYVRKDVDFATYWAQHSSEAGLYAGSKDVLRRLNGLELTTMVITYNELGGLPPSAKSNYQPEIQRMFGLPPYIEMGVGLGCFGGLLFVAGGTGVYLLLSCGLGAMIRWMEGLIDRFVTSHELRAAIQGALALWITDMLKFSGNFRFAAKELIALAFTAVLLAFVAHLVKVLTRSTSYAT